MGDCKFRPGKHTGKKIRYFLINNFKLLKCRPNWLIKRTKIEELCT